MQAALENPRPARSGGLAEGNRPGARLWREFVLAGGAYVIFAMAALHFRESLFVHESSLFGETSWPIWVVDKLVEGKMIYRDASFSYGVLPTYYLAAAAKLFGSTAHTIALFTVLAGALGAASAMLFLRRSGAGLRTRWLLWSLMIAPALWHSSTNLLAYSNLEASLVITILAVLQPVGERTRGNAILAGALMGLLQLTKFGAFLGIGLAVFLMDVFCVLLQDRRGKNVAAHVFAGVIKPGFMILGGFLCVESLRIFGSWLVFPPDIWKDYVIFPIETLKSYKSFGDGWAVIPWIQVATWGYRIGTIASKALIITLVFAFAASVAIRACRARAVKSPLDFMALLSALWFGVGFLFYYHHLDHIVVYSAPLVVAAAAILPRFTTLPRWVTGAMLGVLTGGVVYGKLLFQKDDRVRVTMPNGEQLWFKEKDKAVYEQLSATVNQMLKEPGAGQSGAVVVWRAIASGWYHFMGWPNACRHSYIISPEWIRPYEFDKTMQAFLNSSVFIAKLPADGDSLTVTDDRATWRAEDWLRVPPAQQSMILDRLSAPVRAETVANCWIAFKLKPPSP